MGNLVSAIVQFGVPIFGGAAIAATLFPNADARHIWECILGGWFVFLIFVVSPYRLWVEDRKIISGFEEAGRPKIIVSDPLQITEPKGVPLDRVANHRTWQLRITNNSASPIKNCYVKMKSLRNGQGYESANNGMRFKLSTDRPALMTHFNYRQTFDLPPGGHEDVEIIALSEAQGAHPLAHMLYAIPGGGANSVNFQIPQAAFPHDLSVQVCADEIMPMEISYTLKISNRILYMEKD